MIWFTYSTVHRSLVPALEKAGLHVIFEHEAFSEKQKEFVDRYFEDNVYPVLTPMAMDSSRPFPLIRNKTLNIGALLSRFCHRAGAFRASESGDHPFRKKRSYNRNASGADH